MAMSAIISPMPFTLLVIYNLNFKIVNTIN